MNELKLNKRQIKEIKEIFFDAPFTLVELPKSDTDEVNEDSSSYFEDALKKQNIMWRNTIMPAIANDSGLEIRALNGVFMIYSSRFLRKDTPYDKKIAEILHIFKGVKDRQARFLCAAELYLPDSKKYYTPEDECNGEILKESIKEEGFGYDYIFKLEGFDKSFAELGLEIKNQTSYRRKALEKMKAVIQEEILGGTYDRNKNKW